MAQICTLKQQQVRMGGEASLDHIVVPSQTIDPEELKKLAGFVHYEERSLLWSILLLARDKNTRVVFVSSTSVPAQAIQYYMDLACQTGKLSLESVQHRFLLLSCDDPSAEPLAKKLLERPETLQQMRNFVRDPEKTLLSCILSTQLEVRLAEKLGVVFNGCPPELSHLGTKNGSRMVFAKAEVPHPPGSEEVFTLSELAREIDNLWQALPEAIRFVVKHNDGVAGEGNKMFYLSWIAHVSDEPNADVRRSAIQEALNSDNFATHLWLARIPRVGAIVELWVEGNDICSPSAQGEILSDGSVVFLSTHEQILNGQKYLGCEFPAHAGYEQALQRYSDRIGRVLSEQGARGRYSIDFVCSREARSSREARPAVESRNGTEQAEATRLSSSPNTSSSPEATSPVSEREEWTVNAIEINLRTGGTTHPFEVARGLMGASSGFHYRSTDNFRVNSIDVEHLVKLMENSQLAFDPSTHRGVMVYFMGAVPDHGKCGLVAIGPSRSHVQQLWSDIESLLAIKK